MNENKLADALARFKRGDMAGAQRLCNQLLRRESNNAPALHLLGVIHLAAGQAQQAIAVLKRGLVYAPDDAGVSESLGLAYLTAQDGAAAEPLFRGLIERGHANGVLHMRLGLALSLQGKYPEAETVLRRALALAADEPDVYLNLGNVLAAQNRLEEAVTLLQQLSERAPNHRDAHYNRGTLLQRLRRFEAACAAFDAALAIDPAHLDSHNNRGIALEHVGKAAEAEACYRKVLALAPDHVPALSNLGKVLRGQGRLDESAQCCTRALALQADFVDAHLNLAGVRAEQGDYAASVKHYTRVLQLSPDDADAHVAYGMLCLGLGQFESGWRGYQWRPQRRQAQAAGFTWDTHLPAALADKKILLVGEQGLGDELFFLRYAPWLHARGAQLLGFFDSKIAAPLQRTGLFAAMHAHGSVPPASEFRFMVGDLPWLMGRASDDAQRWAPLTKPLRLSGVPARVDAMRVRLAALGPPPYVGLTWRAGTPPQQQIGRVDRALFKQAPMVELRPALADFAGTLIALQRLPRAGEIAELGAALNREVHDLSAVNDDIEDMLALLSLLHDYIGVSNTNMHLMAGIGGRARVLVPNPPEWRWMTAGDASPWFPGFKVYRQAADGDWRAAFRALAMDISLKRNQ